VKTELRVAKHSVLPGQFIVEFWHDWQLFGQVCGADGPGVRVLSKYKIAAKVIPGTVSVAEIAIVPRPGNGAASSSGSH
jgi:hypothetical protein